MQYILILHGPKGSQYGAPDSLMPKISFYGLRRSLRQLPQKDKSRFAVYKLGGKAQHYWQLKKKELGPVTEMPTWSAFVKVINTNNFLPTQKSTRRWRSLS
ncbi:hypothetical protein Nepgr_030519 [Nepenthes gracilis]|uniref:Uncharacterized protein n=1 Tax=Nepenthes gracilis TaxID=150966 RepID=A0AAD3TGC6_NEPGR|nr:hypothetical protein Nepgr_030519 [Nepenthes gracilis]